MIKAQRSTKFLVGILAALSLCVSSVAACACAHHHPKPVETEIPSCHRQSHGAKKNAAISESADASCECFMQAPGPKVFVKNENKIGEQAAASKPSEAEFEPVSAVSFNASGEYYPAEIFVPNPYYNLTPGRAPPRL